MNGIQLIAAHNLYILSMGLRLSMRLEPPLLEMVVASHNEDLSWINPMLARMPGAKLRLYCTGAQPNDPRCKMVKNLESNDPIYLQHILTNYDKLADITVFALGSVGKSEWNYLLCRKLNNVISNLDTFDKQRNFSGFATQADRKPTDFLAFDINFDISKYRSHTGGSQVEHCRPTVAPLGQWYKHFISKDVDRAHKIGASYNGIFAVSVERIRKFPLSTYEALFQEHLRCEGVRSTACHFMERSWKPMFDSMPPEVNGGPNECPIVGLLAKLEKMKGNGFDKRVNETDDAWEITPPYQMIGQVNYSTS